jgi:hypothetical protein
MEARCEGVKSREIILHSMGVFLAFLGPRFETKGNYFASVTLIIS